jgi:hypothetical protein
MNDWRQLSRLPESDEYWKRLNESVQQSLHGVEVEPVPVHSLAPYAWAAVAAALAAVIASSYLPGPSAPERSFQAVLAPADSTGAAWLAAAGPPTVMQMLETRFR